MYVPSKFRGRDREATLAIMRRHAFATLITASGGSPFVSHIPVLHRGAGDEGWGSLWFHVARANPHVEQFSAGAEMLAIFHGPHTYISPTWYSDQQSVPTWNYVVVHARGKPRPLDEAELKRLLDDLAAEYEAPGGWSVDTAPDVVRELLPAIAGFEMVIEHVDAKLKLSQNRAPEDQQRVREMLARADDPEARNVAAWMERSSPKHAG